MSNLKVWDGSQWRTLRAVPGPQGPQGPVASADVSPRGPAGGALTGWYPNPIVNRVVTGGLIEVQEDWATDNNWYPIANNGFFMKIGSTPLQIVNNQTIDTWWEVDAFIGGMQKDDAAYHYSYLALYVAPADMDGLNARRVIYTQYNGVQTHAFRAIRHVFRCAANTQYVCNLKFETNGGTWQHSRIPVSTWLRGKTWPQVGVIS
jgi:hypothetical protein